jgi:hypothetical protein
MNFRKAYRMTLIFTIITIWILTIAAKFSEYDENYGLIINALLISLIAFIAILVSYVKRKTDVIKEKYITFTYLITSSPLSIILFIALYIKFIGQYFKL